MVAQLARLCVCYPSLQLGRVGASEVEVAVTVGTLEW